jgi:hypothetical protein
MSVLRRPVALSVSASARFRNEGAEAITPKEANATLPDFMKYLLFMLITSSLSFGRGTCAAIVGGQVRLLNNSITYCL